MSDLHADPTAAGSPVGPSVEPSYRVARPRSGLDTGSKRLLMLAGGFGAALLLLIGGWSFTHRSTGAVPVIEADGRPLRVKPENPGGMQVVGLDEQMLNGGPSRVAAGPEAPSAIAMRAQQGGAAPTPPQLPTAEAPAQTVPAQSAPAASPALAPAPARPAAQAAAPAQAPLPAPPRAPAGQASAPQAPAVPSRAAGPGGAGKRTLVQLAATDTESAASGEWKRLSRRMPDILGGHQPTYQKVERNGRTVWRLRTGGFADAAEATAFCARVKSKGVDCAVASF